MKTVWKFTVPVDDQAHALHFPGGFRPLHVACQDGPDSVQLWAEVEPGQPPQTRVLRVAGTGRDVVPAAHHVGTALALSGRLVWHLYDVTTRPTT